MKKYVAVILAFTMISFKALACSCDSPSDISEAFETSNTILYGEVIEVEFVKVSESINAEALSILEESNLKEYQKELLDSDFLIKVKVKPHHLFKGQNQEDEIFTFYTTRTAASCGYTAFKKGEEYLIYASQNSYLLPTFNNQYKEKMEQENTYWVSNCSKTYSFDSEDYHALNNVYLNKQLESISRNIFKILKRNDKVKDLPDVYTEISFDKCEGENVLFQLEDKEINTSTDKNTKELYIHILSFTANEASIEFRSFDEGKIEHNGSVLLVKREGVWNSKSFNSVTTINNY